MPIKGLSDRRELPSGGHLRLGDEKQANRPGRAIDHFRFDPEDTSLVEPFRALYGPNPKRVVIAFHSDDPEEAFSHYFRRWQGGKVWCFGDNETARRMPERGSQGMGRVEVECNEACPFRNLPGVEGPNRDCQPEGWLKVLLPEISTAKTFSVTARSTSIKYVNTLIDMLLEWRGRLRGIPLIMSLRPFTVRGMTNYAICLDPNMDLIEMVTGTKPEGSVLNTPGLELGDLELPLGGMLAGVEGGGELNGTDFSDGAPPEGEGEAGEDSGAPTEGQEGLTEEQSQELDRLLDGEEFTEQDQAMWKRVAAKVASPDSGLVFMAKLRVEKALRVCSHLSSEQKDQVRAALKAGQNIEFDALQFELNAVENAEQAGAILAGLAARGVAA